MFTEAATDCAESDSASSKQTNTVIKERALPFPGMERLSGENEITQQAAKQSENIFRIVKLLKEFNDEEEGRRFDASVFPCNVCFAEKMGSQSIRFPGKFGELFLILANLSYFYLFLSFSHSNYQKQFQCQQYKFKKAEMGPKDGWCRRNHRAIAAINSINISFRLLLYLEFNP